MHIVTLTKNRPAVNAEWHLQSLMVKINKKPNILINTYTNTHIGMHTHTHTQPPLSYSN